MKLSLRLDHVGVVVRDLESGYRNYTQLGFALTPRSDLMAAKEPDGPVRSSGASNHCAMLEDGYIEILGTTNPTAGKGVADRLALYEGLHIIALRGDDAEESYEVLKSRTKDAQAPVTFRRNIEVEGRTETLEFRTIVVRNDAFREAAILVVEHKTPDLLWRPDLLSHPNGALAMAEVFLCPRVPQATADHLARVLGATPEWSKEDVALFALDRGQMTIISEAALVQRYRGVHPPSLPCPVGFAVTVSDVGLTRNLLSRNRVPFAKAGEGSIWVGPERANGVVVVFRQA